MLSAENHLEIAKLTKWDFPNTVEVPSGYDYTQEIVVSDANFKLLVEEHNKLVDIVNILISK